MTMITGFNTDINHQGTVFHIQTEDGGSNNPVIVSLVYQGGRILASKKTSYAQIMGTDGFLSQLRQMLENQHTAMIKAVQSGTLGSDAPLPADAPAPAEGPAPPPPTGDDTPPPPSPDSAESFKEKNLDQVILEYLASEMEEE